MHVAGEVARAEPSGGPRAHAEWAVVVAGTRGHAVPGDCHCSLGGGSRHCADPAATARVYPGPVMNGESLYPRLEPLLAQVQKPIQYLGGELKAQGKAGGGAARRRGRL